MQSPLPDFILPQTLHTAAFWSLSEFHGWVGIRTLTSPNPAPNINLWPQHLISNIEISSKTEGEGNTYYKNYLAGSDQTIHIALSVGFV